jgi:1,4-dihydroxy-2-naphthoate octaprenyltransferase
MSLSSPQISPRQAWILAARPKTLPAAAAPVVVGTAVALSEGVFSPGPALAALLGALLIQIATNFANDVFDYKKGADTGQRLGPLRVTQAGLLTPAQVMAGMWLTFGLAVLVGVYLVWVGGWPIVVIGLLSILSGMAYTGGPFPLGYNGLGDLFVFIFFGLVAVGGTYYVQALTLSPAAIWLRCRWGCWPRPFWWSTICGISTPTGPPVKGRWRCAWESRAFNASICCCWAGPI